MAQKQLRDRISVLRELEDLWQGQLVKDLFDENQTTINLYHRSAPAGPFSFGSLTGLGANQCWEKIEEIQLERARLWDTLDALKKIEADEYRLKLRKRKRE